MPATPADILLAEGNCFRCYSANTAMILKLALMTRTLLALNPAGIVTPDGLLAFGSCYRCYGLNETEIMEASLLDQIAQAA